MDHPRVRDQPHRFSCWALPCRSACLRPCSGESGLFLIFCSPSASIRYRSFREQVTSHVSRFPASLTYPTAIALAALCAEPPARAGPDVVSKRAMEALNSGELSSPVVPYCISRQYFASGPYCISRQDLASGADEKMHAKLGPRHADVEGRVESYLPTRDHRTAWNVRARSPVTSPGRRARRATSSRRPRLRAPWSRAGV